MLFKAIGASVYGIDAQLVQVEVDVGTGRMEDFNVVGLPDNAVKRRSDSTPGRSFFGTQGSVVSG
jgi:magnesium chelatase family protein